MNDTAATHVPAKRTEQEKALAVERRRILALAPENALTAILDHPLPVTLVQSFAEEDLYLLAHAIGPDDALPVLGLASNQQWEYFLDMECWQRDRLDHAAMTRWLQRLLKADPDRLTHWISRDKLHDLECYLCQHIEVRLREHDQDPSELGDGFFTEDDTFYVRLRKPAEGDQADPALEAERDQLLPDILKRLSLLDYAKYQNLLLESGNIIPAESEEELYRLRSLRLAEKGFLPFEEAIGVYQPLTVAQLLQRTRKPEVFSGRPTEAYPLPAGPGNAPAGANLFVQTLASLQDEGTQQRLQAEFAGLCNQVISADQRLIREKEALSRVVQKVSDYISIGLEKTLAETPTTGPYFGARLIQDHLLADILAVGYGCALALKWRAERWRRGSWFAAAGLSLHFWGESGLGLLGGLLLKKPLYYDNYASGAAYREFATLAEIRQTEARLLEIMAFDDLLAAMSIHLEKPRYPGFLTYRNLLLTMWANHHMGTAPGGGEATPLALDVFRPFFTQLWKPGPCPRRISTSMKELFLGWLADRSGLPDYVIAERMGEALERLFAEIEKELGRVPDKDLDPRYIDLFLLHKPAHGD